MKYEVLVIGSGPAGFETAQRVARAGKSTVLITTTPPGGRTTVGSLLPSKGWLHAAHHRVPSEQGGRLTPEQTASTAEQLRAGIAARVAWTHKELETAGVTVLSGTAELLRPGHVQFTPAENPPVTSGGAPTLEQDIEADHIVLATGSEPTFTPNVKPDGKLVIAPRHTKMLADIPESLIMVGGGITGVEYAEAFARLGTQVTLLSSREILPRFDREYVGLLQSHLEDCGVSLFAGSRVTSVDVAADQSSARSVTAHTEDGSAHTASMAFIATGRAADLGFVGLGEEERGTLLDPTGTFIQTDTTGRTRLPGVYACGDAAGPPFTANHALHQARRVAAAITGLPVPTAGAANAAGGASAAANAIPPLIEAIYTDPQLVQIGTVVPSSGLPVDITEHRRSW
ncbi:MAG: FAD-dependent oxidoreductase, partial [Spirochaeta sp.]|nr:FAD-dependent oxidoreductase [Spirochaeta sp.]